MRLNEIKNFKGEEVIFQKDGKIISELDGSNLKNVSTTMENVIGLPIEKMTLEEFEALENKDNNKIYIIVEEDLGGNGNNSNDTSLELVTLGILPKQISKFTDSDIGTIINIPYTDESNQILLNNGCIEFEVVGVNHHKDVNDETKPTITLMTKDAIRRASFDVAEPDNPDEYRNGHGNNRWSVSNIRQWLNSEGEANEWFTPQHEYDAEPSVNNVKYHKSFAYADDPGFLAGFSSNVKQHFATVRNKTFLFDVDKSSLGVDFEETDDKVFLPSLTEMVGGNNPPEGSHLSKKFIDSDSRKKTPVTDSDFYYTRTVEPYDFCNWVRVINSQGDSSCDGVNADGFIAPLIVLF